MPRPISCTRIVTYVAIVMWWATMDTIPSVPVIVAAAKMNGIVAERRGPRSGHRRSTVANGPLEPQSHARCAVTDLVDDEELTVRAVAEVVLQDRPRALRGRSRNRERVREQRA